MKLRLRPRTLPGQQGFTLVEMVMVLGVAAVIAGAVTGAISQVVMVNAMSNTHMTAVKEVENAVHWITRDVQMAQDIATPSPGDFPLILSWTDWNGDFVIVTYFIVNGKLLRNYSLNSADPKETVIVGHLDPTGTSCSAQGKTVAFSIISEIFGMKPHRETRSFTIVRRTG